MTQTITKALELNKIDRAKQLLSIEFNKEHKAGWNKLQQSEYEVLYPVSREMTADEKSEHDTDEEDTIERLEGYEYPTVQLEYISTDEEGNEIRTPTEYLTFQEYLQETEVVTEAELDEDGNVLTPEVTKLVREYAPMNAAEVQAKVGGYEPLQAKLSDIAKELKAKELDALTVTANTIMYDADGKAMGNMGIVIGIANFKFNKALAQGVAPEDAYDAVYKTVIGWKGADNEVHMVQVESICEAAEAGIRRIATIVGAE